MILFNNLRKLIESDNFYKKIVRIMLMPLCLIRRLYNVGHRRWLTVKNLA